jgi:hypothetical protein
MPRLASVHEESVDLVPHATSFEISALIAFSSTAARAILPAGRGSNFGCGFPRAGSAGSSGLLRCAKTEFAQKNRMKNGKADEINERMRNSFRRLLIAFFSA